MEVRKEDGLMEVRKEDGLMEVRRCSKYMDGKTTLHSLSSAHHLEVSCEV